MAHKTLHLLSSNRMRIYAGLVAVLLLTSCISSNRIRIDSQATLSPDFQPACRYAWPDQVSEFLSPVATGINNPGWAYYSQGQPWLETDEQNLGLWLANMIAEDVAFCETGIPNQPEVKLVIYYLSYELPVNVGRTLFDMATVLTTLGSLPVDESTGYMMCLEIRSQDTVQRHALVSGRIKVDMNIWGTGRHVAKAHAAVTNMMQALGKSAWQSVWSAPAPKGTMETDCAAEFAAAGSVLPKMISRQEREAAVLVKEESPPPEACASSESDERTAAELYTAGMNFYRKAIYESAVDCLRIAAEAPGNGSRQAMWQLCLLYELGQGVNPDLEVAKQWCERASAD